MLRTLSGDDMTNLRELLTDEQVEYARNAILIAYQGESDNHKKCRATINALCDQAKAANRGTEGSAEPVGYVTDEEDGVRAILFEGAKVKHDDNLFTAPPADESRALLERAKGGCIGYATFLHYDEQISESQAWKDFAQQIEDHLARSGK